MRNLLLGISNRSRKRQLSSDAQNQIDDIDREIEKHTEKVEDAIKRGVLFSNYRRGEHVQKYRSASLDLYLICHPKKRE